MVHYSLAMEYYKRGERQRTVEHLLKYLSLTEDQGAAYRILAKCYEEMGEYERAVEVLQEGIQRALKYNHPSMAEEFRAWIEDLKGYSF